MLRIFGLSAVALALLLSRVAGQDAKNYLLMPVTTDLQRLELGPGTTVYAAVDGAALVQDGKFDPTVLSGESFRQELAALAAKYPGSVKFHLYYTSVQSQQDVEKLIDAGLRRLGRQAGFAKAQIARTFSGSSWRWQEQLDWLAAADGELPDGEEPVQQDDSVRVYPVRSRLTRWLTGNASAVVFVRQPFDGRGSGLSDKARDSTSRFLGQLQLPQKGKLLLSISSTRAGEFSKDQFIESGAKQFAASLGFASSTVRHSPNGGAPESLLGKPAPDFTLLSLEGNEIKLRAAIARAAWHWSAFGAWLAGPASKKLRTSRRYTSNTPAPALP